MGHLDRLEKDYAVVARHKPINAKPKSRSQKYYIIDNFINFWFRFIYRNRSAVETGNYQYIKDLINRDYPTYSGKVLERFYYTLFLLKADGITILDPIGRRVIKMKLIWSRLTI